MVWVHDFEFAPIVGAGIAVVTCSAWAMGNSVVWVRVGGELQLPIGSILYVTHNMASKSIPVTQKKRGRPATGHDPVLTVRIPRTLKVEIDHWAKQQNGKPSRSEAIRCLLEAALANTRRTTSSSSRRTAAKASELASSALDELGDKSAPAEEQSKRKGRLLKGPSEFREIRDDFPKRKR
jgi:Arc/MetJ-type ribon-helix-helix transcriptional regulator